MLERCRCVSPNNMSRLRRLSAGVFRCLGTKTHFQQLNCQLVYYFRKYCCMFWKFSNIAAMFSDAFHGGEDNHNTNVPQMSGFREESDKLFSCPFNFIQTLYERKDYCSRHWSWDTDCEMQCYGNLVNYLSCGMILLGLWQLVSHRKSQTCYGRHMGLSPPIRRVPARLAWFLQEMPSFLIPLLLMLTSHKPSSMGKKLLLGTFCIHYFQR